MQTELKLSINISELRNQRKVILLLMGGKPVEILYRKKVIGYLIPKPGINDYLQQMLDRLSSRKRKVTKD